MLTCRFKQLHAVCHLSLTPFKGGIGVAKLSVDLFEFSDGLALGCHNEGRRGKNGERVCVCERERLGAVRRDERPPVVRVVTSLLHGMPH
jgi:hypothetical protein